MRQIISKKTKICCTRRHQVAKGKYLEKFHKCEKFVKMLQNMLTVTDIFVDKPKLLASRAT